MSGRNRWLSLYTLVGYVFLLAPIVVLIFFSFNDSRRNFQWKGFTLDWYPKLLANDEVLDTTFNAGVGSTTLPVYIYGKVKFGVTPEINAISTIVVAITAVAVLAAWRIGRRRAVEQETSAA